MKARVVDAIDTLLSGADRAIAQELWATRQRLAPPGAIEGAEETVFDESWRLVNAKPADIPAVIVALRKLFARPEFASTPLPAEHGEVPFFGDLRYNLAFQAPRPQAIELLELAVRFPDVTEWAYNNLVLYLLQEKDFGRAQALADSAALRDAASRRPDTFHNTACVYAQVGRLDDAIADAERAKAAGCPTFPQMEADEDLRPLFGDRRFRALFGKK